MRTKHFLGLGFWGASGILALSVMFAFAAVADGKAPDSPPAASPQRGLNVAPPGFTALFNGTDLTGWKGLVADPEQRAKMSPDELANAQASADDKMRAHWKAVDGILCFDGKGDSLCTAEDYTDFEMFVDWKIEKEGDSGIYLRGSPQVQIWDPAQWPQGSGGLYNNQKNPKDPLLCADKPIGEWNTFRIKMIGERVSVWLNGELVVDNTVLENYWDRSKPIYPSGQIELQNHSSPLWFRNVFIREITAPEKMTDDSTKNEDTTKKQGWQQRPRRTDVEKTHLRGNRLKRLPGDKTGRRKTKCSVTRPADATS